MYLLRKSSHKETSHTRSNAMVVPEGIRLRVLHTCIASPMDSVSSGSSSSITARSGGATLKDSTVRETDILPIHAKSDCCSNGSAHRPLRFFLTVACTSVTCEACSSFHVKAIHLAGVLREAKDQDRVLRCG